MRARFRRAAAAWRPYSCRQFVGPAGEGVLVGAAADPAHRGGAGVGLLDLDRRHARPVAGPLVQRRRRGVARVAEHDRQWLAVRFAALTVSTGRSWSTGPFSSPFSRRAGTCFSGLFRRLTANVAWPTVHDSFAGASAVSASPTVATTLSSSSRGVLADEISCCDSSRRFTARRYCPDQRPGVRVRGRSARPPRGRAGADWSRRSRMRLDVSRSMPQRSSVTSTARLPDASSSASAFTHRSCSLPSAGFGRARRSRPSTSAGRA